MLVNLAFKDILLEDNEKENNRDDSQDEDEEDKQTRNQKFKLTKEDKMNAKF